MTDEKKLMVFDDSVWLDDKYMKEMLVNYLDCCGEEFNGMYLPECLEDYLGVDEDYQKEGIVLDEYGLRFESEEYKQKYLEQYFIKDWHSKGAEKLDDYAHEDIGFWWEAEKDNLNKKVTMLGVANLGFWYGRVPGYGFRDNLNQCLDSPFRGDCSIKVYVDEHDDLITSISDHDGTSYYTWYVLRAGVNKDSVDCKLNNIVHSEMSNDDKCAKMQKVVDKYCYKASALVREIYGWERKVA